jgi:hypothetical protein
MSTLLIAFLAIWFILCVLAQMSEGVRRRLYRWDLFHLLPNWRLFAPRPMRRDSIYFRRFRLEGGNQTNWQQLDERVGHPYLAAIWNPGARMKKILIDLSRSFMAGRSDEERFYGMSSPSYIAVLWHFSHDGAPRGANAVQFCIVSARDYDPDCKPAVVFCSPYHRI